MSRRKKLADGEICGECGEVHLDWHGNPGCVRHATGGRTRPERRGKPCQAQRLKGLDVCRSHGPNEKAKAAGRAKAAEEETVELARKLIPDADQRTPIRDPLSRLLDIASELDAFRESLRMLSNKLDDRIRYAATGAGTEQLRAEVATYRQAAKDVTDLLISVAKLNIDERLAKIEERKVQIVLAALQSGLNDAKLPAATKRTVMANVGRHLHSVAS